MIRLQRHDLAGHALVPAKPSTVYRRPINDRSWTHVMTADIDDLDTVTIHQRRPLEHAVGSAGVTGTDLGSWQ